VAAVPIGDSFKAAQDAHDAILDLCQVRLIENVVGMTQATPTGDQVQRHENESRLAHAQRGRYRLGQAGPDPINPGSES
jgi:uncharacterized protein YPO0396